MARVSASTESMTRRYLLIGSLFGASGIALSAAAAHMEQANSLTTVSLILVMHGVLLVSLGVQGALSIALRLGAAAIAFGTMLFAASVTLHAFKGVHLFTHAAPVGGSTMIVGWCMLAIAAFIRKP